MPLTPLQSYFRPTTCLIALLLAAAPVMAQPNSPPGGPDFTPGLGNSSNTVQVTPNQTNPAPVQSNPSPTTEVPTYRYGEQPVLPSYGNPNDPLTSEELILPTQPLEPVPLLLKGALVKTQDYPITLETVLQLVEEQNLYIAQFRMNSKVQKNRFYRSLVNFLPDVEGNYTQSRFQGGIQIFGNEILTIYQSRIVPQMIASTRVYPGGRRIFEALAAKRRSSSGNYLLQGTRQEQLSRAAEEFYQLIEGKIQQDNLTKTVQEARTQVSMNDARLRAGVGTKLELMQSTTYLAQQERILIDAENTFAQAEQRLLNRLNLDPSIHLDPQDPSTSSPTEITLVPDSLNSAELVTWSTRNHPDIRSVELEAKALKSDFIALATDIIPAVDLQAYQSWPGSSFENLTLTRFGGFTVRTLIGQNAGLGWPLDLRQSYLLFKQKQYEFEAMKRTVENQITSAYLNAQAYKKAIDAARAELASAQEASRLAAGRYRVGLGIYLDVLTADSSLSSARTKLASAILGYNRAEIQLLEALGATSPQTLITGFNPAETTKKKQHAPTQP